MLPWIAGAIVVGVGAYLLDDEESNNKSAKKRHKKARKQARRRVNNHYENAQKKDALDKLFKVKETKQKVAYAIHTELESYRENLLKISAELKKAQEVLSLLFEKKHSAWRKKKKIGIQLDIDIILKAREELFTLRNGLKNDISKLTIQLKEANSETRAIQDEINRIVD